MPTAGSPSQTSTFGTAPSRDSSSHQPAYKSAALREGTSTASRHREYPHAIDNTGNMVAVRTCPYPTGTSISGNQKSNCATSPGWYRVRDCPRTASYVVRGTG